MSVTGERKVIGGKGRNPSGRQVLIFFGYMKLISSAIVTTTGGRSPSGGGEIFPRVEVSFRSWPGYVGGLPLC